MFATIFAIYLLLTFIIFSFIFYPTQALDVTNVLSVSVYGAVEESSKTGKIGEDGTIVDCKKGYQQEGNKCVLNCSNYYSNINSECTDTWVGGTNKNSSDLSRVDNTTTTRLGNLNFTESKK